MTGIHFAKSKSRVVSGVRREQNRAGQRATAAGCVCGVRLGFLRPLHSLSTMEVRKGETAIALKPLTVEQSNCFKMVSPTFGCAFH